MGQKPQKMCQPHVWNFFGLLALLLVLELQFWLCSLFPCLLQLMKLSAVLSVVQEPIGRIARTDHLKKIAYFWDKFLFLEKIKGPFIVFGPYLAKTQSILFNQS